MSADSIANSRSPAPLIGFDRAWPWRRIANTLDLLVVLAAVAFGIEDAWHGTGEKSPALAISLAFCGANVLAIERVARTRTLGWEVVVWTAAAMFAASVFVLSAVGFALMPVGLSRRVPGAEPALLLVTVIGLLLLGTTLPALRVRESFRPAWWMHALVLPCLLGLALLAMSDFLCDRVVAWLRGAAESPVGPFDHWDWERQASRLSEDALTWYFLLTVSYILAGMLRVATLRADRELADQAAAGVESV